MQPFLKTFFASLLAVGLTILLITASRAQQPPQQQKQLKQPIGVPVPPLGNGPFIFDTAEQHKIRVSVVAKGSVASLEPGVSSRRKHAGHRTPRAAALIRD